MVFDHATTQDDHASSLGADRDRVDLPDILDNVDTQLPWGGLERVEVEHVTEAAVGQCWTENWDVVLVCPVVHRGLIVDLSTETMDHFAGSPQVALARPVELIFLLLKHTVQYGHDPILERTVVVVRHDEVADSVESFGAQRGAGRVEGAVIGRGEALDQVLLHATSRRDDGRDMLVLNEIPKCLS